MDSGSQICEDSFLSGKSLWVDFYHCEKCFDLRLFWRYQEKLFFQAKIAWSVKKWVHFLKKILWPQRPLKKHCQIFLKLVQMKPFLMEIKVKPILFSWWLWITKRNYLFFDAILYIIFFISVVKVIFTTDKHCWQPKKKWFSPTSWLKSKKLEHNGSHQL